MSIYAFGDHDQPRYSDRWSSHRWKLNGGWCCPIGEGHPTVAEAAQHGAELAIREWEQQT